MKKTFQDVVDEIVSKDPRYHPDAYEFVMHALHYTQEKYKRHRHVTGKELLVGIKEYVKEEFGPMAITVLAYWGVQRTEDFGNIVFNLVNQKVLSRQKEDTIDHFRDVYDFEQTFDREYQKELEERIRKMRK